VRIGLALGADIVPDSEGGLDHDLAHSVSPSAARALLIRVSHLQCRLAGGDCSFAGRELEQLPGDRRAAQQRLQDLQQLTQRRQRLTVVFRR
jgi:hypothetical protein